MTTYRANGADFIAADDMIVRWLNQGNPAFEPSTTKWMFDRLAERRGLYVDVGASTGWFAIPVALTNREVVAVECNSRSFARLLENAEINHVRLEAHRVAASDHQGQATFHFNPRLPLTSGGSLIASAGARRAAETVNTDTLDNLVGDRQVAFLKVDVEGYEMAVLRGAETVINRERPFMVLEANTDAHFDALDRWLKDHSYTWKQADTRNMLCSPSS